jgi:general secretion pathway protein J
VSLTLPRTRGFTLVEVLVALALMSLIGTILIESLRVGGHTWQQVTRKTAHLDEITRAQDFLREHLGTLSPPQQALGAVSMPESFVGESGAIEFSSVTTTHSGQGVVRYWLGLSQSGPTNVEVRSRPEQTETSVALPSAWSTEPLLQRVTGLSIQFWQTSEGSGGHWVGHWGDNGKLPSLIRIDVSFADQDMRRWPLLYIEPRLNTPVTCVFDVVSRRCRGAV